MYITNLFIKEINVNKTFPVSFKELQDHDESKSAHPNGFSHRLGVDEGVYIDIQSNKIADEYITVDEPVVDLGEFYFVDGSVMVPNNESPTGVWPYVNGQYGLDRGRDADYGLYYSINMQVYNPKVADDITTTKLAENCTTIDLRLYDDGSKHLVSDALFVGINCLNPIINIEIGDDASKDITPYELGCLHEVKSNIQEQLDSLNAQLGDVGEAKQFSSPNVVLVTNANSAATTSTITTTELGCLDGVTDNIQGQLNNKEAFGAVSAHNGSTAAHENGFAHALPMNNYKITGLATPTASTDAANKDYVDTHAALPIGTVIWWSGKSENRPAGFLLLDGSTYDTTLYKELYDILGTNVLPNYIGRFVKGSKEAGKTEEAGLPNITGNTGYSADMGTTTLFTGAFYRGTSGLCCNPGSYITYDNVLFDASRGTVDENGDYMKSTDSPYGKSDTVTPNNISAVPLIKAKHYAIVYAPSSLDEDFRNDVNKHIDSEDIHISRAELESLMSKFVGFPDYANMSDPINVDVVTGYTAPTNGFICTLGSAEKCTTSVTVNGKDVGVIGGHDNTHGLHMFLPVSADDVVKFDQVRQIVFIPFKKLT